MSRRLRIGLIAGGVVFFLVVSGLLARFLTTENAERDADLALVQDEAAGNARALIAALSGCAASRTCVSAERSNARRLRRPGSVKIIELQSATAYTLTGATGATRIAWTVIGRLPVVQCIRVRRAGNPISGITITLLGLSAQIPGTAVC